MSEQTPDRPSHDPQEPLSQEGVGLGLGEGEPTTFEPEEDPDAVPDALDGP